VPRRMSRCNSRQPLQFYTGCASARGRVSKTQLTPGGTEAACQIENLNSKIKNPFWGRGRQVMHLPCKQAHMGAVPIDSTISYRGKLDQSTEMSLINSFRWVRLPLPLPFSNPKFEIQNSKQVQNSKCCRLAAFYSELRFRICFEF